MDKQTKVEYQDSIEQYLDKAQLPDYFEKLTKLLIQQQPKDPQQFLIDYLQKRQRQRLILINGAVKEQREELSKQLANQLNYKLHIIEPTQTKDLNAESDVEMNNKVEALIQNTEKHYTGVIISGYPNNYQQITHLQKNTQIAERVFIIKHANEDVEKQYAQIYNYDKTLINSAKKRDELNLNELMEEYGQYTDVFEISNYRQQQSEILSNMMSILKLQDQKVAPLRSPRILIVAPPFLRKRGKEILQLISKKYGLYGIDIEEVIDRHIENKSEVGKFLMRSYKEKQPVPLEIISSLVLTETRKGVAKHKGWVLFGYAQNYEQVDALVGYKLCPNLIVGLRENESLYKQALSNLKIDPIFGKRYEVDGTNNQEILKRLNNSAPFSEEQQDSIAAEYNDLSEHIVSSFKKQYQKFSLSTEDNEKILHSVDIHINNPANYGEI